MAWMRGEQRLTLAVVLKIWYAVYRAELCRFL